MTSQKCVQISEVSGVVPPLYGGQSLPNSDNKTGCVLA